MHRLAQQAKGAVDRLARRAHVLGAVLAIGPASEDVLLALGGHAREIGISWGFHELLPLFSGSATNVSQAPAR